MREIINGMFLSVFLLLIVSVGCISSGGPRIIVGVSYSGTQIENIRVTNEGTMLPLEIISMGEIRITVSSKSQTIAQGSLPKVTNKGYQALPLSLDKEPAKGEKLTIKVELLKEGMITAVEEMEYEWD